MPETQEQKKHRDEEFDDGGPAFPKANKYPCEQDGMTLRDYFAGQAIAGILANGSSGAAETAAESGFTTTRVIAMTAYKLADALIVERQKERG